MRVFEDITIIGLKLGQLGHNRLVMVTLGMESYHLARCKMRLAPVTLEPLALGDARVTLWFY